MWPLSDISLQVTLSGYGSHGHHMSISPTLLFVVPLLFVAQKLFSQPSVVLQEVLLSVWMCIWCVRGGEFGVFVCHHLGLPPPNEEA